MDVHPYPPSSSTGQGAPSLCILKQNSLSEEKFTRGSKSHKVHVVVKNSPFVVSLGTTAAHKPFGPLDMMSLAKYYTNGELDLGKLTFDCKLLYDTDHGSEKEVDYVENKPFQFKVNVMNGGRQVDIEVRLKVLSSQHEDMFFLVKFMALDPLTKRDVSPHLVVHSLPIKVISKPEQLKKRRPSKKRTLNDMLIEALTRIEQNQQAQQHLLNQLSEGTGIVMEIDEDDDEDDDSGEGSDGDEVDNSNVPPPPDHLSQGMSNSEGINPSHLYHHHHLQQQQYVGHYPLDPQGLHGIPVSGLLLSSGGTATDIPSTTLPTMGFEEALENLLQKFSAATEGDRDAKIQKVLHLSPLSRENLVELYDLFVSEGLPPRDSDLGGGGEGRGVPISGECACPACPHRAELERIEVFYRDVFHL